MGRGWEGRASPAQLVDGKAVNDDQWLSKMARTSSCQSRAWGQEAPKTMRKLAVRLVGSEEVEAWWSTATRSGRKKHQEVESYPALWSAAQARRCCYTFNG
jgi:hypothetical protein